MTPPAYAGTPHYDRATIAFHWLTVILVVGLFDIPTLVSIDHEQRRFFGGLHNTVAWSIIVLACIHAVAALVHHYVLRDGVLRRMTSSR